MLLTKSTEYSIKVLLYLSNKNSNTYLSAKQIAVPLNLPQQFVAKILQSLTHIGIINSQKGKGGGFILTKPASEISLGELIRIFEKETFFSTCILGLYNNCKASECTIHKHWIELREEIKKSKIEDLNQNLIL